MKILRTPEKRFQNLPGYGFEAHYTDIGDLRKHYVDEGPRDANPVLLLHGEPSWSYLYRTMIPPIAAAGLRAIAPDLIGFGKSDKPAAQGDYSYKKHVAWMKTFLENLDLRNITLVCQDWGSLIGLKLAAENEERFDSIVLANGGLPTGDQNMPMAFSVWRAFARFSPWFPIGRIIQTATISKLSPDVVNAYDAPFPDASYKAGTRAFPRLVPTTPDDPAAPANRAAWEVFRKWEKPFLTSFSDGDPITRGLDRPFVERVPGATDQPHTTITDAGHFLQEEKGPEFARAVIDFLKS